MVKSGNNSKVLLVVDWSNLMFRSLFMHQFFGDVSGTYDRIEDLKSFTNKFAVDVCSIINMFKPNNVIIATDSQHAWRKDILPGEDGYKSNREKSENVNWDNIYKCSDDLQSILQRNGIHVANIERSEADDIMALIKETVFDEYPDYNIIIVSADADIRQLIDFDEESHQYCVVYNTTGRGKGTKRRMYATQSFLDWVNKEQVVDIFFSEFEPSKQYVKDLLAANSIIELVSDNPNEVILSKIMCGDDGDCVPSFYGFYKDGRYVRTTPAKSKKILEMIGAYDVKSLINNKHRLQEAYEKVYKREVNDLDFSERLQRQRTLVELNTALFPEHIREYRDSIRYMLQDIPGTVFQNIKAQEMLKGTDYEGMDKKRALEADVFKDFERMTKKKNQKKETVVQDVTSQGDDLLSAIFNL